MGFFIDYILLILPNGCFVYFKVTIKALNKNRMLRMCVLSIKQDVLYVVSSLFTQKNSRITKALCQKVTFCYL